MKLFVITLDAILCRNSQIINLTAKPFFDKSEIKQFSESINSVTHIGIAAVSHPFSCRMSALLGTLLMLAFVIGIASAWARGLSIDCGCFGGGGTIGAEQTAYPFELSRDVALTLAGAWLVRRPHTAYGLDDRI